MRKYIGFRPYVSEYCGNHYWLQFQRHLQIRKIKVNFLLSTFGKTKNGCMNLLQFQSVLLKRWTVEAKRENSELKNTLIKHVFMKTFRNDRT